jgi:arsenical pump membrane protein
VTISVKQGLSDSSGGARRLNVGVDRKRLMLGLAITLGVIALAIFVVPDARAAPALATLGAVLCFIFLFPKIAGVPSHVWGPLLGAAALLFLSRGLGGRFGMPKLEWSAVYGELVSHASVPILILSFAYLSISLDDSGFFNWCSLKLLRAGRGSGTRLIISLFLGVSLITLFTSNDIVVLTMTPILIYLGNNAKIRNLVPLLMTQFIAANTASMGLYVGNPTNIVIGNAVGMGFLEYARRMFVPTLVATGVSLALVLALFSLGKQNRMPRQYDLESAAGSARWSSHMTLKVALFGGCLLLLSVFGNPWSLSRFVEDPSAVQGAVSKLIVAVSAACCVIAMIFDLVRDRIRSRETPALLGRLRRMPLEIVPFFLSFCLVLRSLEDAGLTRYAVESVLDAFRHGPVVGSLATGAYAVLAVNVTNNIPATILFEKAWLGNASALPPIVGLAESLPRLDARYGDIFIDGVLFASNFGANLTFIGALAGLMWLKLIQDHARRAPQVQRVPAAGDFLMYGAIIVPVVTLATCLAIAWLRM